MDRADIVKYFDRLDREIATQITIEAIADTVKTLPRPFNTDALVLENLENLKMDISLWGRV